MRRLPAIGFGACEMELQCAAAELAKVSVPGLAAFRMFADIGGAMEVHA